MLANQQMPQEPERSRVSIIERLVPSLSFALAALGGAVGAAMTLNVFRILRAAENAGKDALFGAMVEVYTAEFVILLLAGGAGAVAIVLLTVRMFTTNRKASPSGFLFILPAAASLLPLLMTSYAGRLAIDAVTNPSSGGLSEMDRPIGLLNWGAIAFFFVVVLVLAAFSFVPFNSRTGRKFAPAIFLILYECALVALAVDAFLIIGISYAQQTGRSFF